MGINFNGQENPTTTNNPFTALWTQQGSGNVAALDLGDLPDLSSQYDANRLAAVKLTWFPSIPAGSQIASYAPMTITWDRDGIEGELLNATLVNQLEQVNGVQIKNLYRPWSRYVKAPKYGINTRIPSSDVTASTTTDPQIGFQPNENLAGQWKRVGNHLSQAIVADMSATRTRGTQLFVQAPAIEFEGEELLIGTMIITSYYVYKDRR